MKKRNKETIVYLIGSIIVSVLGFVLSVLYASMFNSSDYGKYSLILSLYSLFSQFFFGWIPLSFIRNYANYEKKNKDTELVSSLITLHLIFSILICCSINFISIKSNIENFYKMLIFIFSLIYYFENQILLINALLRIKGKSKEYSINTTTNSFSKILFTLLLFYVFGFKNILIISISILITEILQTFYLMRKYNIFSLFSFKKFNREIIKEIIHYGFPLIGISITYWILNVSDRYIIQLYYTSSDVGIYAYSYNLANSIFSILMQFIMLGAYPNIVRIWEKGSIENTQQIIKEYLTLFFFIVIPACTGVIALSERFFYLFTSEDYYNGVSIFIITAIGISVLGFSQYSNKIWELTKRTKILFVLNLVAAITNLILNIILIPRFGYSIAAFTTTFSYLIYVLISLFMSRKIFILQYDFKKILKIIIASVIMYFYIKIFSNIIAIDSIFKFLICTSSAIIINIIFILLLKVYDIKDVLNFRKKR